MHCEQLECGGAAVLGRLEEAERDDPLNADLQRALSVAYEAAGEHVAAAAARIAAVALEQRATLLLFNLATGYFSHAQPVAAEKWYRVALRLDPGLAIAHRNLASILRADGRLGEAGRHLDLAFARQWVFSEPATQTMPVASVMLACVGGIGNVPIDHLLPLRRFARIKCFVDHADRDFSELDGAPRSDIVFNAIGDPDAIRADDPRLRRVLQARRQPVLNDPERVMRTRRDLLPGVLRGIDGVVTPQVRRIALHEAGPAGLAEALQREGARYPLILRPAASHGGAETVLATDRAAVEDSGLGGAGGVYATDYHDYRSADGYFRKYRMIFVDGQIYPYHLAISSDWLVHYFSAEMLAQPWKIAEERRFLEAPAQAVGARALRCIKAIARRIGLDYAGVDFSLLADGRVIVFEANATMLVHPEREDGMLAHKNRHVAAICGAFQRMVEARTGRGSVAAREPV